MTGSSRLHAIRVFVLSVVIALAAAVGIAFFISRLGALGHRIASTHLVTDYFVALLWGLGIAFMLLGLPVSVRERKDLVLLWGARCGVTLFAMLFYENHYGLDAYEYHRVSQFRAYDWSLVGFGKGTQNTEALSWVLNHYLPILDSYHALKVVYSFIGFSGTYVAYRGFVRLMGGESRPLLYLLGLFPSMIFWSSILGKDPVILLGIGLYVYGTLYLLSGGGVLSVAVMAAGILIAGLFRSWYLAILVLPLGSLGINGIKKPLLRYAMLALIGVAAAYSMQYFSDQFEVASVDDLVNRTQSVSHSWSHGGSAMDAPQFRGIGGMLKFAPVAMFTALFRPLPGEVLNPFGMMAGLENLALLYALFKAAGRARREKGKLAHPVAIWSITLILVWGFIYGFISYQNLGAASRFRLQILPVMLCLLFFMLRAEWRTEPRTENRPY